MTEVEVTAADFNPALPLEKAWDGPIFRWIGEMPSWVAPAWERGDITPHNRGGTDYAQWDVKTSRGTLTAGPGDFIGFAEYGLYVRRTALEGRE